MDRDAGKLLKDAGYSDIVCMETGATGTVYFASNPRGTQCAVKLVALRMKNGDLDTGAMRDANGTDLVCSLGDEAERIGLVPIRRVAMIVAGETKDHYSKCRLVDDVPAVDVGGALCRLVEQLAAQHATHLLIEMDRAEDDLFTHVAHCTVSHDHLLGFLKQVAETLDELHERRLIHCDVKPENLFIKNGKVWLGDFGWMYVCGDDKRNVVGDGPWGGTTDFRAPELESEAGITSAVDIYSLALTYYDLYCLSVSGVRGHEGRHDFPEAPHRLRATLEQATHQCAIRRHTSCVDFIDELSDKVDGRTWNERCVVFIKQCLTCSVAAVALVLLVLIGVGYFLSREYCRDRSPSGGKMRDVSPVFPVNGGKSPYSPQGAGAQVSDADKTPSDQGESNKKSGPIRNPPADPPKDEGNKAAPGKDSTATSETLESHLNSLKQQVLSTFAEKNTHFSQLLDEYNSVTTGKERGNANTLIGEDPVLLAGWTEALIEVEDAAIAPERLRVFKRFQRSVDVSGAIGRESKESGMAYLAYVRLVLAHHTNEAAIASLANRFVAAITIMDKSATWRWYAEHRQQRIREVADRLYDESPHPEQLDDPAAKEFSQESDKLGEKWDATRAEGYLTAAKKLYQVSGSESPHDLLVSLAMALWYARNDHESVVNLWNEMMPSDEDVQTWAETQPQFVRVCADALRESTGEVNLKQSATLYLHLLSSSFADFGG